MLVHIKFVQLHRALIHLKIQRMLDVPKFTQLMQHAKLINGHSLIHHVSNFFSQQS